MLWSIKSFPFKAACLSILSGILLILAFPKTDYWPLAWFSFIPLFFALDGKKGGLSFFLAYLCGVTFFAGTLYWFIHVTYAGATLLILYCSLYFGLFGLALGWSKDERPLTKLVFLSCFWVVLEYTRGNLFSGFGWASLGHSQYKNIPFIQIADLTGVSGVSFALMVFNAGFFEIIRSWSQRQWRQLASMMLGLALFLVVIIIYGAYRLSEPSDGGKMQIAVV